MCCALNTRIEAAINDFTFDVVFFIVRIAIIRFDVFISNIFNK